MKNRRLLGNLILTACAIIWGTAFVAQRAGMDTIEPITFNAARMVPAALIVGTVALVLSARDRKRGTADPTGSSAKAAVTGGVLCGFLLSLASIFQQVGLVETSAGKAGFITAMYILFVPVIGFVFLRRKNPWIVWAAVLLGVFGMYLLCVKEGFTLTRGDALILVCALLFSGHILVCDHFVKKTDPIRMSAVQFVTASIVSWIAAFVLEEPGMDKIIDAAFPILYCGVMSGGIAYTLQMIGQKLSDPTPASLLMSLEAVFAVIAGAVILGERMQIREIIGCIVMFAAVILVQLPAPGHNGEPSA